MNRKIFLLIIGLLLTLVVQPTLAYDVVIDPGHGGDEQNRGGPAFTVDDIGSTLTVDVPAGELQVIVNNAKQFTKDTEPYDYSHIMVGTESCTVEEVNYENDVIELSSPLSNPHPAGEDVTVQDFLVQAMGQKDTGDPGDWGAADTDYARLSYTHEVPANQWDEWKRKENTDGAALGVLELLNTWRISTRLDTKLSDLGHTVEVTKDSLMDDPSFQ